MYSNQLNPIMIYNYKEKIPQNHSYLINKFFFFIQKRNLINEVTYSYIYQQFLEYTNHSLIIKLDHKLELL